MEIFINNLPLFEKEIREVAEKVVKGEKLEGELSITFIDDAQMEELNKKFRKREGVTDVLAFAFHIPQLLGDIYICVPQALRQKKGSILDELKLLTVHGILHIAGYSDETEEDRKKMREKEKEYLS
ncbi:MAG: rRNA maturation RNase YbeY [candidate division WOR-3 bacterium]